MKSSIKEKDNFVKNENYNLFKQKLHQNNGPYKAQKLNEYGIAVTIDE